MTSQNPKGPQTSTHQAGRLEASSYVLLRLPAVLRARGRSRSSHYEDIKAGVFTRPVYLGVHCVGWPEAELIVLNEARIAGKDVDEIRALVRHLEARRRGVT
jgi:prophage regulatory protein